MTPRLLWLVNMLVRKRVKERWCGYGRAEGVGGVGFHVGNLGIVGYCFSALLVYNGGG